MCIYIVYVIKDVIRAGSISTKVRSSTRGRRQ